MQQALVDACGEGFRGTPGHPQLKVLIYLLYLTSCITL